MIKKTFFIILIILMITSTSFFVTSEEDISSSEISNEIRLTDKYFEYFSEFSTSLNETFNTMIAIISIIITSVALFFGINIYNQTKHMNEIKDEIKDEISELKSYKRNIEEIIDKRTRTLKQRTEEINYTLEIKTSFNIFRMKLNTADAYFNKGKYEEALSELDKIKNLEDQLYEFLKDCQLTFESLFEEKNAQKRHIFNTLKDYRYTRFLINTRKNKNSTITSTDEYSRALFDIDNLLLKNDTLTFDLYYKHKIRALQYIQDKSVGKVEFKYTFDLLVFELNLLSYFLYKEDISLGFKNDKSAYIHDLNEKITDYYLRLKPRLIQVKYNYLEYTRLLLQNDIRQSNLKNFKEDDFLIEKFKYVYERNYIQSIASKLPFNTSNINNCLYSIYSEYCALDSDEPIKLRHEYFLKLDSDAYVWSIYNSGNYYLNVKKDIYKAYKKFKILLSDQYKNSVNSYKIYEIKEAIKKIELISEGNGNSEAIEKLINNIVLSVIEAGVI